MGRLTPQESVKAMCRSCLGNQILFEDRIQGCEGGTVNCVLFPYRMGKRAPLRIFRAYCLKNCMDNHTDLVFNCTTTACAAHPYRHNSNPARKGFKHKGSFGYKSP